MKMNEFHFALENLKAGHPVILATIIRQMGSSPRGKGARLVMNQTRQIAGSVGGGQLEERIKNSFETVITDRKARIFDFTLSEVEAESLEMICGGSISILVEPILPDQEILISTIQKIVDLSQNQKHGWLISQIPGDGQEIDVRHVFISAEGQAVGNLDFGFEIDSGTLKNLKLDKASPFEINFNKGLLSAQEFSIDGQYYFIEPIGKMITCFIIGAGHIAQKLAPLVRLVGFTTVILDDRPDYISQERFPTADQTILLEDFQNVIEHIQVDPDSFLVIVTRGHSSDKAVLGQALQTQASYIGMIGSRRKIALIFEALKKEGFDSGLLDKVHSPIGLSIGAETPEEIAISIVAEMIQERAKLKK